VINGEKQWISNGHYSDYCICVARFIEEDGEGIGLIVVDREHGYESRNIPKMAMNRQSTAQLFFSDVRVPASQVLFPAGEGLKQLMVLLAGSRPFVGLMALGISQRALDHSITYAQDRQQHGKPIAAHQLIQARVAEMAVQIEAARLMLYKALVQVSRGERADLQSGMAKYFATEMACAITRHALAIHGGNGVTPEYPVEELYRLAPIFTVTEGTAEMQKLIIGRQLLGVPAF
jgi:alkylation response protein AidB-like acyl-CoA dehydrogenase